MGEVLRHQIGAGRSRLLFVGLVLGVLLAIRVDSAGAATFTVCPAGPPNCQYATLADAVAVAGDGDRVSVAPGTYAGGFAIAHSIRLIGSGQGATVIAGGDPTGITIPSGVTVTIRAVAITGAALTGIENDGDLTLRDSSVSDNNLGFHTTLAGGVLNNGTIVVSNTTMSGNWAYAGGAIANFGRATVTSSTVRDNSALFDAGGIGNNGSLVVRDSTFEGNHAQGAGAIGNGMFSGHGEALVVNTLITGNSGFHGAIINRDTFTLKRSTVSFNGGFAGQTPAIQNEFGSMVISKSVIEHNPSGIGNEAVMTITSSSVNNNVGGLGGIQNDGSLTVRGSTLHGNSAQSGGGGISNGGTALLISSTISGNSAQYGGGIANFGGLTLRSSIVTQNTAVTGSGGGIYNEPPGIVTLRQSSVSGNSPDDCFGC